MSAQRVTAGPGTGRRSLAALLSIVTVAAVAAGVASLGQRPAAAASASQAAASSLTGVIRDAKGVPMGGVAVSARSDERTFTTSVYTDERGEYVFPPLAAGRYQLWAQAVTFTTERAAVVLDGTHTVVRNLAMKPLASYEAQLTGIEWYDALPEDSAAHRRMKQVLYVACTGCHGLDVVLQNRFDEDGWRKILKAMESAWYTGWRGGADLPPNDLRWESQITRHHEADLARYLAEMRGPGPSPMQIRPMPRPSGAAARVVVTEYDLPITQRESELPWYNGADWMDGPSTGMHGIVGTHDVTVDAAGFAWISHSEGRSTFESNRAMIKLDPRNGDMTAIKLTDAAGRMLQVEQISSIDPFGAIWMHNDETNTLIKLDTTSGRFTGWPMPRVMNGMENSTDADSKGRVWINARYGVAHFDPSQLNRRDVAYPGWQLFQQHTPGDGITYGISADADDNPWWSESYVDKVATRNMKTGVVTEIDMRDPDYAARKALMTPEDLAFYDSIGAGTWSTNSASPLPYANMPRRLAADKHGDKVWVPNWAQSNIAEIDIHSLAVTYHRLPIHVHPYKTIVDKHHNVWTDTSLVDGTLKFDPASGEWTVFRLPSRGCGSRHMGYDDFRDEAWIACDQASKAARIQFRTPDDIRALKTARR